MQSVRTIGITGGSGAGKTALSAALKQALAGEVLVMRTDWYYRDLAHLSVAERAAHNFDHPDSLEWPLLVEQVATIRGGGSVDRPQYGFSAHTRLDEPVPVGPVDTLIVEGVFTLARAELRELLDVTVFVDADQATRFERRLRRDVRERGRTPETVDRQFSQTVIPMHQAHIEPQRSYARVVVNGEAALTQSVNRVLQHLEI